MRVLISLAFVLCLFAVTRGASGDVDASFNASVYGLFNGHVNVIKRLPSGKFLVGGVFTDVDGVAGGALIRLNSDLTVDPTFNPPDFGSGFGFGSLVYAIGVQSDGKIVVGGNISGINNVFNPGLKRLLPDGTPDLTFTPSSLASGTCYDIEIAPDDKILANGLRLNADGTHDTSFLGMVSGGREMAIQPDGKLLGGDAVFRRYMTDGTPDPTFTTVTTDGTITAIKYMPDGKVLIAGSFQNVNGFQAWRLARINSDGSLDLTFNQNLSGPNFVVSDIEVRPNGKIVIAGSFSQYNTTARNRFAQLNADGSLDTGFTNDNSFTADSINDIEILDDGRLIFGVDPFGTAIDRTALLVANTDGTIDPNYRVAINMGGTVNRIVRQSDGKYIVAGSFLYANGSIRRGLVRLNADGTLDSSFVPYFTSNKPINAIAIQSDGKIVVGSSGVDAIRRLNPDGTQDSSFAPTNLTSTVIYDVVPLPDGSVVAGGASIGPSTLDRLNRYLSNGTRDAAFGAVQPNGHVRQVRLLSDGRFLISGGFSQIGTTGRGRIARLNADGSLDTTFNPPGGANDEIASFDVQADGKIAVGGTFTGLNGNLNMKYLGRFDSDGSLDTTFVPAGTISAPVTSVRVQSDGKIIAGGGFNSVGAVQRLGLARFTATGAIDSSFNGAVNNALGVGTGISTIALDPDGRVLVGGTFTKINNISRVRIARLQNSVAPRPALFDFDGDGKSDVAVFRATENKWYILRSSDSTVVQTVFAIAGDVAVPADYDGDGKTDVAIFRPANGNWWYVSSISGTQINYQWGQTGDIPRPSDFDGDGKTDFVVYRPSNNVWYRYGSTGAVSIQAFGVAGDIAVIGDFDGDSKADNAVFRPSTGDWWYASSISGQFLAVHWGASGDIPVPADYDGDGKTDFAIFRPSDGGWFVASSGSGGFSSLAFGLNGDRPIAADYDGDGRADVAVFRPSTGIWYLLQSQVGFGALQWGIATDAAVPNVYLQP